MEDKLRAVAEWAGLQIRSYSIDIMGDREYFDLDSETIRAWLLSPPGTVAILDAFLRDGYMKWSWVWSLIPQAYNVDLYHMDHDNHPSINGQGESLPEAVLKAAIKYWEDKPCDQT